MGTEDMAIEDQFGVTNNPACNRHNSDLKDY